MLSLEYLVPLFTGREKIFQVFRITWQNWLSLDIQVSRLSQEIWSTFENMLRDYIDVFFLKIHVSQNTSLTNSKHIPKSIFIHIMYLVKAIHIWM